MPCLRGLLSSLHTILYTMLVPRGRPRNAEGHLRVVALARRYAGDRRDAQEASLMTLAAGDWTKVPPWLLSPRKRPRSMKRKRDG